MLPQEGAPGAPMEGRPTAPQETSHQEYLVYYSLSSLMLVRAKSEVAAAGKAFATLHTLVDRSGAKGITPKEAGEVRLEEAEVGIDSIEKTLPPGTLPAEPAPSRRTEFFEITSVARADLEELGFDASQVDDATMEHLARKLADDYVQNHFWLALDIIAELQDVPKRRKTAVTS